jgi:hypothetical protein
MGFLLLYQIADLSTVRSFHRIFFLLQLFDHFSLRRLRIESEIHILVPQFLEEEEAIADVMLYI